MVTENLICNNCHEVSNGEVVYHGFFIQMHCPECGGFIRNSSYDELVDFKCCYGKYSGFLISEIAQNKESKKWLEWAYDNLPFKDWQLHIINLYL